MAPTVYLSLSVIKPSSPQAFKPSSHQALKPSSHHCVLIDQAFAHV